MTRLTRLKVLHASNNNFTSLKGITNLRELESLVLNNNSISDISELSSLKSLKILKLDNNNISDISELLLQQCTLWFYINKIPVQIFCTGIFSQPTDLFRGGFKCSGERSEQQQSRHKVSGAVQKVKRYSVYPV